MVNFASADSQTLPPDYDPNGVGSKTANIFGLPSTIDSAKVVIIPVPWEVTVSYGAGTARGPAAVVDASTQLDLYDPEGTRIWEVGVAAQDVSTEWLDRNDALRTKAAEYISALEQGESPDAWTETIAEINQASTELNSWLEAEATKLLMSGKKVGVLGGDHSSPLGLMQALAKIYDDFSILHIDAHADLRIAYEGFQYSHASIMDNALKLPEISRLVQVGIRDLAPMEADCIKNSDDRVLAYYDWTLKERLYTGQTWHLICEEIVAALSDSVYVSFDIDGLDPSLCPHTGTPVPGGLQFSEVAYLLKRLARSGKQIIGFDLCEVAPGTSDWNGNVGARVLYRLISAMIQSQQHY
ncbi:agmatinase family protein [Leptolyngbya ohadii]|uniref:agmatinase family protein n=1 Tax=Leptolyngbya ohadii TaxID=1962290 RepID=UPI000B5991F5|nr:agmatinase family protein [Leptolyngbya ohadii]